jgi:ketosteroid isomerase-like protein
MPTGMDNLTMVKDVLGRVLPSGDLGPLLDALADDIEFEVVAPGGGLHIHRGIGKAAVHDYFATLGDLITFWRPRCALNGPRVDVQVEECFTIQPGGFPVHGGCTLQFGLRDGRIASLLVVEEPPGFPELVATAAPPPEQIIMENAYPVSDR